MHLAYLDLKVFQTERKRGLSNRNLAKAAQGTCTLSHEIRNCIYCQSDRIFTKTKVSTIAGYPLVTLGYLWTCLQYLANASSNVIEVGPRLTNSIYIISISLSEIYPTTTY